MDHLALMLAASLGALIATSFLTGAGLYELAVLEVV
jgi:hypothetical protein